MTSLNELNMFLRRDYHETVKSIDEGSYDPPDLNDYITNSKPSCELSAEFRNKMIGGILYDDKMLLSIIQKYWLLSS